MDGVSRDVRERCAFLLAKAFLSNADHPEEQKALALGKEIEEKIYAKEKKEKEYSKLFRSKYLNLKERGNRRLCNSVYNKAIGVAEFITMTTEQMKSEELKKIELEMKETSLKDAQTAKMQGETDIFLCHKCNQRNCTYGQLQTRSADEPMTTYVYCVCGNTWKF
jgi:transcription elongation factor S-II